MSLQEALSSKYSNKRRGKKSLRLRVANELSGERRNKRERFISSRQETAVGRRRHTAGDSRPRQPSPGDLAAGLSSPLRSHLAVGASNRLGPGPSRGGQPAEPPKRFVHARALWRSPSFFLVKVQSTRMSFSPKCISHCQALMVTSKRD